MADNLKTLLRLYRQYAKMDLLWFLRDTRYFLLQLLSDTVSGVCTIAGVCLLSASFRNFSGMNREEILFMMGYSVFIDGIYMMFFIGNNTSMVSRIIGRGQLDHIMIQPVPLWAELLAQGFSPFSGSPMLAFGTALTWYGAVRASIVMSPGWILLFLVYGTCSCLIILSFLYLLSCTAFYAPAAAEEIAMVGRDLFSSLKTYPLGNMNAAVKGIFLTVIPIGLTAWFPSVLLLRAGREGVSSLDFPSALYVPAASAILLAAAILFFRKGMKHYARYGSPRYTGFGHR
ncbi:ABC-2 family transporter protein [Clostridium sp. Marseille-P2415]|uniref:ABC-2 family transporter protein n=1 Tax=Clostridium sp. Marseille-P2415 TaxID=1805471 RepID=UPI001F2086C2|nr:ABC-2 family transporter protein [Clostridium sp. Marseille-P2415]